MLDPKSAGLHRSASQAYGLGRIAGYGIIAPGRNNIAHLHRAWRATCEFARCSAISPLSVALALSNPSRKRHCSKGSALDHRVRLAGPAHSGIRWDNLVGLRHYFGWYGNAKSLGGLKVDHELVGERRLDR